MSLSKATMMDQDDLEEELFYNSICGHLQILVGIVQSSPVIRSTIAVLWRVETLILALSLLAILVSIARFDKKGRFLGWVRGITSCTLINSFYIDVGENKTGEAEWAEVHPPTSSIYSLQGRRSNNEDRAVFRKVSVEGCEEVLLWAVMDGHGGEFSVNFCQKNLIPSLTKALTQLKILTSRLEKERKIAKFEELYETAPSCVKLYLGMAAENEKEDSGDSGDSGKNSREQSEDSPETKTKAVQRNQVVLSPRKKSLEEIPGYTSSPKTSRKDTKVPKERELSSCHELQLAPTSTKITRRIKTKSESGGGANGAANGDKPAQQSLITDYIDSNGEIMYAQLIKDEILKCDKDLLKAAKAAGSIGGTTLLISILDGGMLWVGNVGDSRGIYCSDAGLTVPMSYDHKPCQLKEKRRIQEAGGFVSMNGVWRVQGVLATSRALGDYPLKEKKVIVAEPDILSFNIKEKKIDFAVLATDGLWDTHSNEEVADFIKNNINRRADKGAKELANDSYERGSTDNITLVVMDLKSFH